MLKRIKLLCTLGPSSLNRKTISRLDDLGVDLFRINLSHTEIDALEKVILKIKEYTGKPICLDSEGAQVRTGCLEGGKIRLEENARLELTREKIIGNHKRVTLTPESVFNQLEPGDLISIDFESVLLQILQKSKNRVIAKVVSGGIIGSNKAVTVDRPLELPVLTEKDLSAIAIGLKNGIRHFALSFASSRENIIEFREHIGREAFQISKVESKEAIRNIDDILEISDAVLIDRGDLSREEPIEKIPFIQKLIIKKANERRTPVYVATNLLESMVISKKPTRAEANDVINTLMDGADGLVLAAETAIGAYPVNCALMISKMIHHFIHFSQGESLEELQQKDSFLLVEPHGGRLIDRVKKKPDREKIRHYPQLEVDLRVLSDARQIALGSYSPLEGFMTRNELEAVLETCRLPDGTVWPLPIVLQTNLEKAVKKGDRLALVCPNSPETYFSLEVEEVYTYNLDLMAKKIFGTDDGNHPGVRLHKERGEYFIGGKIELFTRPASPCKKPEITPAQSRLVFETKGWNRVAGFCTNDLGYHHHKQLSSMEKYHCDGIFVQAEVSPTQKGETSPATVFSNYEMMLEKDYPEGKVFFGLFSNYPRYAGPREAVFSALCRKNFGCSHVIIESGDRYHCQPEEIRRLFDALGDLDIIPILI